MKVRTIIRWRGYHYRERLCKYLLPLVRRIRLRTALKEKEVNYEFDGR
jgi:hypothetical protein